MSYHQRVFARQRPSRLQAMSDHLCFAKIAVTRSEVFGMGDGDIENVDHRKTRLQAATGPGDRRQTNKQTNKQTDKFNCRVLLWAETAAGRPGAGLPGWGHRGSRPPVVCLSNDAFNAAADRRRGRPPPVSSADGTPASPRPRGFKLSLLQRRQLRMIGQHRSRPA